MAAKVFIDGEAGTTGLQIRERLATRRDIKLLSIPDDKRKDPDTRAEFLNAADIAILCLPDEAAIESVALVANGSTRIIDTSSAHRVKEGWCYGFPEMHNEHPGFIESAMRVANPGCWPQGVIAALRPLVYAGLVAADYPFTVNGISGYSGGGRGMISEYEGRNGKAPDFLPYGLGFKHKHLPEMQRYARLESRPLFMPAVGNFYQGMLVCMPLQLNFMETPPSSYEMHKILSEHYNSVPGSFIQVAPLAIIERSEQLNPQALNGTNYMRLHVFGSNVHGQAILVAVYDNLGKGAAGAAIQNLNLMLGLEPSAGLV